MKNGWAKISAVAADLGASDNNIRVWRQRVVPYKWRLLIMKEAKRRKIRISEADFARRHAKDRTR